LRCGTRHGILGVKMKLVCITAWLLTSFLSEQEMIAGPSPDSDASPKQSGRRNPRVHDPSTNFRFSRQDRLNSIVGFVNARRFPAGFLPTPIGFCEAIRTEALYIFGRVALEN
jgi:hypothetical protein